MKALEIQGGSFLADLSIKFPHVSFPLEVVAAPMDKFRACIWEDVMPLEDVAAPEANFCTENGQGFCLCRF